MAIELVNVEKKYGEFAAVDNLSMVIKEKEITVLIGSSGCGKTTTMKMINGLIPRTGGDILIDGISIDALNPIELRRRIGYVIQDIGLFPHYTIFDNIATVPRLLKWDEKVIKERVYELLDLVNLEPECAKKYPAQLSGGQRQRVGVARGLAADPDIILMDEPFGAIDPINREVIQDNFLEIQKKIKKTIVFVTHDIHEAIKLGDSLAILDKGKLIQYDSAFNVVNNPTSSIVSDLLGADRAFKGLELLRVRDHMKTDPLTVSEGMKVAEAKKLFKDTSGKVFFLLNSSQKIAGYVSRKDLEVAEDTTMLSSLKQPVEALQPSSTLLEAMTKLFSSVIDVLPVVDSRNHVKGSISIRKILKKIEEMAVIDVDDEEGDN